jgi:hypothetical protein
MTYVMTKSCPVCKQPRSQRRHPPTPCSALAESMYGKGNRGSSRIATACGHEAIELHALATSKGSLAFCAPCRGQASNQPS